MGRFKDFGKLNEKSAEYRAGWRYQIRFSNFHAPKTDAYMLAKWCDSHWDEEQRDVYGKTELLWCFLDSRWLYMKHAWQVIEFKVRWFGEEEI